MGLLNESKIALDSAIDKLRKVPVNAEPSPAAIKVIDRGRVLEFSIASDTGKVSKVPPGAWGWALNFRWKDFKVMLEREYSTVELVMPSVMAAG
jgi:hypothetical protein